MTTFNVPDQSMDQYAVVIAAYNEARTIRAMTRGALRWCPKVYVVDDGSTDGTAAAIADLDVVLLRHGRNEGKGASLWDGMQAARADGAEAVITLDADGQHEADDIPRLVERHRRDPTLMVIGARLSDRSAFPPLRYCANRFANFWIAWAAGAPFSDSQSGFRIYPAAVLAQLGRRPRGNEGFVFESRVLIDATHRGVRSTTVPIPARYQPGARPSHFRAVTDVLRITRMVAAQLLRRGLHPQGLWNITAAPPLRRLQALGRGAATTLALSTAIMLLSMGLSWLAVLGRTLYVARRAPAEGQHCDALLVLGLQLRGGAITDDYVLRLERARLLLGRRYAARVLLLGGRADYGAGVSEAAAGRDYLLGKGVAAERVRLEDRSRNTLENLQHGRALLTAGERVTLISNRYHLARCQALARALGLQYRLCAAEPRWSWRPASLLKAVQESVHLHWLYTGRAWARLTADPRLLSKLH